MSIVTVSELPKLATRAADSHKGDYGRVLIIGGSRGMSGAVCLAAKAALRGGAGLVRAAVPEGILPVVSGYEPSYLTAALPEDDEGRISALAKSSLAELVEANDTLAVGPGLGRSSDLNEVVASLFTDLDKPLILDADALNALAEQRHLLVPAAGPRILTPHPGEFARLTETSTRQVQADRENRAMEFARRTGTILVLKGSGTLVTDGERLYTNPTGNPGMATGGSGDVLTGLVTALVAQHLAPFEAACLGVYLHGLAGDLAAEEIGQTALIASDLLDRLPKAIKTYEGQA